MTGNVKKVSLLLTEDISPHKISLVVLLNLYCCHEIQESHLVSVLSLLVSFLENDLIYKENGEIVVIPEVSDLCYCLRNMIVKNLGCLGEAENRAAEESSIYLEKKLLAQLWGINSIEQLDACFTTALGNLASNQTVVVEEGDEVCKKISPRSLFGSFIRTIVTTFKLLLFDEVSLLFEAFIDYREASRALFMELGGEVLLRPKCLATDSRQIEPGNSVIALERRNFEQNGPRNRVQTDDDSLFDALEQQLQENFGTLFNSTGKEKNTAILSVPKHDVQVLLDKQISLLETHGVGTPRLLKNIMKLMTDPSSNTCLIQNANFNNLPSYYYVQYLDRLHDYDYHGAFRSLHQYFDYMVSNNSKYFYHFALISRASLHQYFGEDEKALDAIQEAISVARENKDNATLTYILSWLFNFMRNKPDLWNNQTFYHNNNMLHLLEFLVKVSPTVSLLLYAVSYQCEIFGIMNQGGPPSQYFESLLKTMYISINDRLQTFIKSSEIASTVWSRVGIPYLSEVYLGTADFYAKETGNVGSEISVKIRKAYFAFYKGFPDEAYAKLEALRNKTTKDLSLYKFLLIRRVLMLVEIDLRKGRIKLAESLMDLISKTDVQELETCNEITYLKARVQVSLGNFSTALREISDTLALIESEHSRIQENLHMVLRLNLLKCSIFNSSGAHSRALSLIIQLIQNGKQAGFKSIVIEGLTILVSILNNLGKYEAAYEILNTIMPEVLALENCEDISTAYYEFSRTCYHLSTKSETHLQELGLSHKQLLNKFLKFLNISIGGFRRSLNLIALKKCFNLEKQMAVTKGLHELEAHSIQSLDKLRTRAKEEAEYGLVISKLS